MISEEMLMTLGVMLEGWELEMTNEGVVGCLNEKMIKIDFGQNIFECNDAKIKEYLTKWMKEGRIK